MLVQISIIWKESSVVSVLELDYISVNDVLTALVTVSPFYRRYPDSTVPLFGSAVGCWVWNTS